MVRLTKEEKRVKMENFLNEAEEEIKSMVNINDDENAEIYNYIKGDYNWMINKKILKSDTKGKENLIEIIVKRNDNINGINKRGETIEESSWVYIENKNLSGYGDDYAIGRKDSKIKNGLSYQNYRLSRYYK